MPLQSRALQSSVFSKCLKKLITTKVTKENRYNLLCFVPFVVKKTRTPCKPPCLRVKKIAITENKPEICPMLQLPKNPVPIQKIATINGLSLFIKREDMVHPEISGNKFWKLFYNINNYLGTRPENPLLITFGGAFSNHISAVAALGNDLKIPTLGIIRGEELENKWQDNETLKSAHENGMNFRFVTRENYRNKADLERKLHQEFPGALIIPEGGTNALAVEAFRHVLSAETNGFDYICTAVGTGGTVAGLVKFAAPHQKVIGFKVVKDNSLEEKVEELSGKTDFKLVDASFGGYGKINDEVVRFINQFYNEYKIPLDPVYTGKMMMRLKQMIDDGYFPEGSRILAIHTGGLQGIKGANEMLRKQKRPEIAINKQEFL